MRTRVEDDALHHIVPAAVYVVARVCAAQPDFDLEAQLPSHHSAGDCSREGTLVIIQGTSNPGFIHTKTTAGKCLTFFDCQDLFNAIV